MKGTMTKRSAKAGLPPGSLVYVGEERAQRTRVSVIDFDEQRVDEREVQRIEDCVAFKESETVSWIDVDETREPGVVAMFGQVLGFHPLMQEDILATDQRAKLEDHGDYLYLVLKMLSWDTKGDSMENEQLSLVLGRNYVITFQERAGDFFDPLRQRIREGLGPARRQRADYLAYSILDLIVDHYFLVLEKLGERIERVEDLVMTRPRQELLREIHDLKRAMLLVRKSVWPVKEVIASLRHVDSRLIARTTAPYLRDLQDHVEQVLEGVETYQNLLSDMLATYLSTLSNRTNTVMRVLAVFSAVFMPLTFLTGIFGMNFRHMPVLEWDWGFPVTLGAMLAIGGLMVAFFLRRRWL